MTPAGTVVVTGAAGQIGAAVRPFLAQLFESVRLVDVLPTTANASNESVMIGDVSDPVFALRACMNADAVIHLAAKAGVSSGSGTGIPSISSISTARDRSHEGCPRASLTSGSPPPTCGEGMAPW